MKKLNLLFLIIFSLILFILIFFWFSEKETVFPKVAVVKNKSPLFPKAIEVSKRIYSGIDFLSIKKNNSVFIRDGYYYDHKCFSNKVSFDIGLSCISLFYSTGDSLYLKLARQTARKLDSLLPATGLVPEIVIGGNSINIDKSSLTYFLSCHDQKILEYVCYLSMVDSSYKGLVKKLADGLIKYGINPTNHLTYYAAYSLNGNLYHSDKFGYENQFGSGSSSVAEALITAYKVTKDIKYKENALQILKSIWSRRNKNNDLISETWDMVNDRIGKKLYPYGDFRYDDMGGAYIRALVLTYQYTHEGDLIKIMNDYTKAICNAIWDKRIGGGAFRYITRVDNSAAPAQLETMYGLFIGTLLMESEYLESDLKTEVLQKCREHADHVFLTDYGVKNYMIPHSISEGGKYTSKANDSQLGCAVLQFPYGMNLLSIFTGDNSYRYRCNQIIDTLTKRHAYGDNINSPEGYVSILETQPPYGFEHDYSEAEWCREFVFLPAYLLFNSIIPSDGVRIIWHENNYPGVFGLVCGMPYWDLHNVNFNYNQKKIFCKVKSDKAAGTIDFSELGFNGISKVSCDGRNHDNFKTNTLTVNKGLHNYEIIFR